jgi:hypothetical protein
MACSTASLNVASVRGDRLARPTHRILIPVFLAGCWAAWCPCVVYSKNKQRLEHLRNRGTPLPGGGERLTDHTYIHGILTAIGGHGWILQVCSDDDKSVYDLTVHAD